MFNEIRLWDDVVAVQVLHKLEGYQAFYQSPSQVTLLQRKKKGIKTQLCMVSGLSNLLTLL